jgi:hypothetical protein
LLPHKWRRMRSLAILGLLAALAASVSASTAASDKHQIQKIPGKHPASRELNHDNPPGCDAATAVLLECLFSSGWVNWQQPGPTECCSILNTYLELCGQNLIFEATKFALDQVNYYTSPSAAAAILLFLDDCPRMYMGLYTALRVKLRYCMDFGVAQAMERVLKAVMQRWLPRVNATPSGMTVVACITASTRNALVFRMPQSRHSCRITGSKLLRRTVQVVTSVSWRSRGPLHPGSPHSLYPLQCIPRRFASMPWTACTGVGTSTITTGKATSSAAFQRTLGVSFVRERVHL